MLIISVCVRVCVCVCTCVCARIIRSKFKYFHIHPFIRSFMCVHICMCYTAHVVCRVQLVVVSSHLMPHRLGELMSSGLAGSAISPELSCQPSCQSFFSPFFLLNIFFIYTSNVISFPSFPSRNPPAHPPITCLHEGAPPPIHLLLPHCPSIPLCRGIEPPQDRGPPFPLMLDKAILCYMCDWSHGSLHVYSLVGGLVPGSSGGLVGWYCWSSYGLQIPSAPSVLSLTPPLGTPFSVQWLASSIRLCNCQALAELTQEHYNKFIWGHYNNFTWQHSR